MSTTSRVGRRRAGALGLLGATALVLSGCGGSGSSGGTSGGGGSSSGERYAVGFVLQLSGPGSVYAETAQAGTKAAIADVNAKGTAGRTFTAVTADAGADPQSTSTACSRLIQQEKVRALVVFVPGPQLLACNSVAGRRSVPVLSLSSGAGTICAANLVSYGLVPNQQTLPVIDALVAQGKKKWYFFGADYATPKATIGIAAPYLTAHGGTVVGQSFEPNGTSDYSQDINAIVSAKPDVAFLNVIGNDDVTLQKQWAADPRTKGIERVDILLGEGAAHALGSAADGVWSANAYFSSIPGAGNDAFKAAVRSAGLASQPDINSYVSYLQVQALARAVKAAGTDGAAVLKGLNAADFSGPVGRFQSKDAFTYQPVYLAQAAGGGFTIRKTSDPVAPKLACKH